MEQSSLNFTRSSLDVPVPAARRSHTSRLAAERLKARGCRGPQMARLLGAYAAAGVPGLTMGEIAEIAQMRESSICSLRAGAVEKGWLLPLADTRVSGETGMSQALHRITTAGLQVLAVWKEQQR